MSPMHMAEGEVQDLFSCCSEPGSGPEEKSENVEAEMYCDGASLGNPGHAGVGVVIRLAREPRDEIVLSEYIGIATNNTAEYSALIRGLRKVKSLGLERVAVFLDSELLVKQLNGTYRVRSKGLMPMWEEARHILNQLTHCPVSHIRRELNGEADLLAKRAAKKGAGS